MPLGKLHTQYVSALDDAQAKLDAERHRAFLDAAVRTKHTRIDAHGVIERIEAREKARFRSDVKAQYPLFAVLEEKLASYGRGDNIIHQRLRHIHKELANAFTTFGVPADEIEATYEDEAMAVIHDALRRSMLRKLHMKLATIGAMRRAKRNMGRVFGEAAREMKRIPKHVELVADHVDAEIAAGELLDTVNRHLQAERSSAFAVLQADPTTANTLAILVEEEKLEGLDVQPELEVIAVQMQKVDAMMLQHRKLRNKLWRSMRAKDNDELFSGGRLQTKRGWRRQPPTAEQLQQASTQQAQLNESLGEGGGEEAPAEEEAKGDDGAGGDDDAELGAGIDMTTLPGGTNEGEVMA